MLAIKSTIFQYALKALINMFRYILNFPTAVFLFFLIFSIPACKKEKNKADVTGMGDGFQNALFALVSPFPLYTMSGELNLDYTQSCGTVTQDAAATGTTTTSGTAAAGKGSDTTSPIYKISSYFMIDTGKSTITFNYPVATAVILTRFKYDQNNTKFTLSPVNTTFTTCKTSDYITCDTGGAFICETVDSIKCGAAETFIYTSKSEYQATNPAGLPAYSVAFQGYSGTVDWSRGFTLSADNTQVDFADLEFNMVAKDNSIFKGSLKCRRPSY